MPLITYTTEADLQTFMQAELGEVAAEMGAPDYQQAINAVLRAANIATVDLIPPATIEILARVEIWRRVVTRFLTSTNWSGDGLSVSDAALFANARTMLADAESAARRIGFYPDPDAARSTAHRIRFTF